MVMIQVHDVNQSFDELIQFKQNHWKPSPQLDQIDSNSKTVISNELAKLAKFLNLIMS